MPMFDWLRSITRGYPLIDEREEPDAFVPQASTELSSTYAPRSVRRWHDGEKFAGGFGPTQQLSADYWTLRARSSQLFTQNLYARGLIRRLVTAEINTGLHLEATPVEPILGVARDSLSEWSENVENLFSIWARDSWLCDSRELLTFGKLQAAAKREALVTGDVLVVMRQFQATRLPRVQLIDGASVRTPWPRPKIKDGYRLEHGVEMDSAGRHVAFWVSQRDGKYQRMPAWGEKSGRRLAWLVYGTDKRHSAVRGEPLLSLVLQSLREIDRYRDSTQRKAVINSMIAMFIERTQDKPSALPFVGGAVRRGVETATNDGTVDPRSFNVSELMPGMALDMLQPGEKPHGFAPHGTDEKFGDFEEAVLRAVAWANEVPPEIMLLGFSSNYSASQAANNEFKMYLDRVRTEFGNDFCQPVYDDWLLSMVLSGKIQASGLVESWRNAQQYDRLGAWTCADWSGHVKPAVDPVKLTRALEMQLKLGLITHDRAARELNGTKFSQNVQRLRIENESLRIANEALEPPRSSGDTSGDDRVAGEGQLHVVDLRASRK